MVKQQKFGLPNRLHAIIAVPLEREINQPQSALPDWPSPKTTPNYGKYMIAYGQTELLQFALFQATFPIKTRHTL